MKRIMLVGIFLIIGFSSCTEDENNYMNNGTITGVDFRECACCGGYFIDIKDSTYRFFDLPGGSDVNLQNPIFPIYVKLDWAEADTVCLGDEIKVLRIEKR
jgi:hypothetical protein